MSNTPNKSLFAHSSGLRRGDFRSGLSPLLLDGHCVLLAAFHVVFSECVLLVSLPLLIRIPVPLDQCSTLISFNLDDLF